MELFKYTLSIILFLSAAIGKAQLPTNENGETAYVQAVFVEGQPKAQLCNKAKLWIDKELISKKIPESDINSSKQIARAGTLDLGTIYTDWNLQLRDTNLDFEFRVSCKEEGFKYEVSNFSLNYIAFWSSKKSERIHTGIEKLVHPQKLSAKKSDQLESIIMTKVEEEIDALIDDFKAMMRSKSTSNG